jgi:hypothetical protein
MDCAELGRILLQNSVKGHHANLICLGFYPLGSASRLFGNLALLGISIGLAQDSIYNIFFLKE